jgi:hypothetical protein
MYLEAIDLGVSVNPTHHHNYLSCCLDGLSSRDREQQRVTLLEQLGLLDTEIIPIFDEAVQTAARFLEVPIALLTILVYDQLWIKSALGLSRLGLRNPLAAERKMNRQDGFCTHVVDSQQSLTIFDTYQNKAFAQSLLTQHYGIRAYLGTPLLTSDGHCIGSLAVMDLVPHDFSCRDLEFLTMTNRWCMSEFERDLLQKNQTTISMIASSFSENNTTQPPLSHQETAIAYPQEILPESNHSPLALITPNPLSYSLESIKLKLLHRLVQELQTPLTAVIGMSSVLRGEVFGKLSPKQKEYLGIIHNSGENIHYLVKEILNLGSIDEQAKMLELIPVNIEMLAQKAINSLSEVAKQKRQDIRLSIEPGKRVWLLDKDKFRQAIYYVISSVMEASEPGGEIRIHISRRSQTINFAIWMYHPWVGDGLPHIHLQPPLLIPGGSKPVAGDDLKESLNITSKEQLLTVPLLESLIQNANDDTQPILKQPQKLLGLLLGCYLIEFHGGKIIVQGSSDAGYRYVMMLPKIAANEDDSSKIWV